MKYIINGTMTVGCWTEVEADSKEEALAIAQDRADNEQIAYPGGISMGAYPVDENFHFDSDGIPSNLEAEEG